MNSSLIKTAVAGVLPATLTLASCTSQNEVKKPNIIYILADDLGRADIGCFGQEKIETPNIDRLAQEGMCFTNHYSGQAVSAPSRCSLFTGLHMGHAYIRGMMSVPSVEKSGAMRRCWRILPWKANVLFLPIQ